MLGIGLTCIAGCYDSFERSRSRLDAGERPLDARTDTDTDARLDAELLDAGSCRFGYFDSRPVTTVEELFDVRCGTSVCHDGPEPAAGLDLVGGDPFRNMVGVTSVGCPPRLLIDPISPDDSELLLLLRNEAPECGDPMPFMSRLHPSEIECVRQWISANLTRGARR